MKSKVDTSDVPSFILNFDDKLSVFYANQEFYRTFETDEIDFSKLYSNRFSHTLTFHHQLTQAHALREALLTDSAYQAEVEVVTATGGLKSLFFEVREKITDSTGVKLFGFLKETCGQKKKKRSCYWKIELPYKLRLC